MAVVYNSDAKEVGFLVGGIGTGTFSVGARGDLKDFEWFNRPGKGNKVPYTFFALYLKEEGKEPQARVLEARRKPPYTQSHGYGVGEAAGLPRFERAHFAAEYPFANISLEDEQVPLKVEMEVFNPFIPLDDRNSGIPAGVIRYRITNQSEKPVEVAVCGSLTNVAGVREFQREIWESLEFDDYGVSEYRDDGQLRGLYYFCEKLDHRHLNYGNLCLTTTDSDVSYKRIWLNRGNWDGFRDFWNEFRQSGTLMPESHYEAINPGDVREMKTGSLSIKKILNPGETYVFEFTLGWYYPNRQDNWEFDYCNCGKCEEHSIRNFYAAIYADAWEAAAYLNQNLKSLEIRTRRFTRALYDSTLPQNVIESVANNMTTLRSTVCFRLSDGTFLGWEGAFNTEGCCEGNCTHVWNYAQTLAFLFPELEKSMRKIEFQLETDEQGKMAFRTRRVFGKPGWEYHPAADGQLGCIIRLYRDYLLTGDLDDLRQLWPDAKRALEYAFNYWDANGDYVLDAQQHNTYDIEFYGENSLTNSVFFAALKAASQIEARLDHPAEAKRYRDILEQGARTMDELLWNGEYYRQNIENVNKYLYQYGDGCLSDQIFGQLLAHITNLGYILPQEHIEGAALAVHRYNFKKSLRDFHGTQRVYALNDEAGLVLCTWPRSEEPTQPFIYSDEVWAGVEYQVAAQLIYEGHQSQAFEIIDALRKRYDGYLRNPFCEVECGNHYVRSMASYMLLLALCDFKFDMTENKIDFNPKYQPEDFQCFFSTGKAWGILRQKQKADQTLEKTIEIIEGEELYLGL